MLVEIEAKPLVDITQEAMEVLFQRLGTVNTTRFLNQFTVGFGDYTEERDELFGHLTLDELVADIKQHRER
jgi:hypothetical protein